eukprot:7379145-Prymnesium_polylepis.2
MLTRISDFFMHSPVCVPASGSTRKAQRAQEERRSILATPAEPPETVSDGLHPAQPTITHARAP